MKTKKTQIHPFTELHFISNLPLDRSSELISCVAYPHPMVLDEVNPDIGQLHQNEIICNKTRK